MHHQSSGTTCGNKCGTGWRDGAVSGVVDHGNARTSNTPYSARLDDQCSRFINANPHVWIALEHTADEAIGATVPQEMLINDGVVDQSKPAANTTLSRSMVDSASVLSGRAPPGLRSSPVSMTADITAAPADVPPITASA